MTSCWPTSNQISRLYRYHHFYPFLNACLFSWRPVCVMFVSISEESCLFFNLHGDEFYIFILSGGGLVWFECGVEERGRVLKTEGLVNWIQILVCLTRLSQSPFSCKLMSQGFCGNKMPHFGACSETVLFLTPPPEVRVPETWSHLVLESPHRQQEPGSRERPGHSARPSITEIPSIIPKFFSFFKHPLSFSPGQRKG